MIVLSLIKRWKAYFVTEFNQLPGDDNSPSHIPTHAKVVFYLRAGFAKEYHVQ